MGSFIGGDDILTALVSYNKDWWTNPKDSIFGTTGHDYDDRVHYDSDNGNGQKIPEALTPFFSGVVYADEGITAVGIGKTVRLMVNGSLAGSDLSNDAGDYTIVAPANAGDAILVYIDGDPSYQGNIVTVMGTNSPSGLDIYAGHVITRQDNGGALTNANLAAAKGGSCGQRHSLFRRRSVDSQRNGYGASIKK